MAVEASVESKRDEDPSRVALVERDTNERDLDAIFADMDDSDDEEAAAGGDAAPTTQSSTASTMAMTRTTMLSSFPPARRSRRHGLIRLQRCCLARAWKDRGGRCSCLYNCQPWTVLELLGGNGDPSARGRLSVS